MTDYIREMRKYVGHGTIIQVGASVILENAEGEVLLQRRADNGCWAYAGGAMEIDERAEDAARRELFEETGLTAGELELFGVFSGPDMRYTYPNGDEVSNIDIVYICRDYSGELRPNPEEVAELRFFAPTEFPKEISPPNVLAIKAYLAKRLPDAVG